MKLNNGKITVLINHNYTEIEILDDDACTPVCVVRLTPEQLSMALSRLGRTPCEIELFELDRIGKVHEHKAFSFEIPEDMRFAKTNTQLLYGLCRVALKDAGMDDWTSDNSYKSQGSFYNVGEKYFATTTIRRWVSPTNLSAEPETRTTTA